jgi:hypothetical protein
MTAPIHVAEVDPVDYNRQRERTVDNLKRLFALVFSLSFALAGAHLFALTKPFLLGDASFELHGGSFLITLEMFGVFAITAAVFYHQGAKFLDNKYAWPGDLSPHPYELAWDFFSLVLQMVPFVFLASVLAPDVISRYGFTWFFFAYIVTFYGGLILLLAGKMRDSVKRLWKQPTEREKEADKVRNYWLLMNSTSLLVIGLLFAWRIHVGDKCPPNFVDSDYSFLGFFGVLALLRDFFDYSWVWPFVYPVKRAERAAHLKWPLTRMLQAEGTFLGMDRWFVLGLVVFGVSILVAYGNQWFELSHWVSVCRTAG